VYLQLAKHWDPLTGAAPASHVVGRNFQLATDVQKYLNKAMSFNLHPLVVSSYAINRFQPTALFSMYGSKQNSLSSTMHDVPLAGGCVHHVADKYPSNVFSEYNRLKQVLTRSNLSVVHMILLRALAVKSVMKEANAV
jgi:hypothetical protein